MKNLKNILRTLFYYLMGFSCYAQSIAQPIDVQQLEKDVVGWLSTPSITLKELHGGLTNISFVGTNIQDTFVVRIGKKDAEIFGIDRFCEDSSQRSASHIGIAPTVLYSDPGNGTLISTFIKGETFAAKKIDIDTQLKRIVQLIKKCHAIPFKKEFESPSIYEKIRSMIRASLAFQPSFISREEAEKINIIINQIEAHFRSKEKQYEGLCHGDLLPGNFIDDGKQLWLIDWEYASWGNILFDLVGVCTELNFNEQQSKNLLELYFGPTWQEHFIDFELMRAIFNLRNAFWYDLRGKEVAAIGEFTMADYAQRHLDLFKQGIEKLLPSI